MPSITLTNEQVVELIKQLPAEQQTEVFQFLLLQQWPSWDSLSKYGEDKVRRVAQDHGHNWDTMTEEEREAFVDQLVHEN
ncbi:hypothetical protein GFS31_07690 [Leptolyngbya sp. BL0902]|uniref:hypothetical protein n=1 Tax=Leptolyngbya sp. BL0902 TaxID=1115757 RepID=UPI0018E81B59|nr:hypothetical protein [Leptolyngbya sp. BL0902]QQE64091.1 hypothetical protein GFS31_07690 [Leptolyngbya sp. BL0902]